MGRIKKVATERHTATLSYAVADFVREAASIPLHELPKKLAEFPQQWPFPRGDLYHWIAILDRFDHILELFNKEYGLNQGPQTESFGRTVLLKGDAEDGQPWSAGGATEQELDTQGFSEEGDRELIEAVLHFTRILLEHCGNRSLYASSAHLNDLLHTTSLSVLRLCLKLSLRLAQRYQVARFKNNHPHAQSALMANHYAFDLDKLHKMALPFPKPNSAPTVASLSTPSKSKEKMPQVQAFNPSDLVSIAKEPKTLTAWTGLSSVHVSWYDQSATPFARLPAVQESVETPPVTPTPVRRTSNLGPSRSRPSPGDRSVSANDVLGTPSASHETESRTTTPSKTFQILADTVASSPAYRLVHDAIPQVPADIRFDLLNRVRIAKALSQPEKNARELLEVRLLAIANLAYALNESKFNEKIGVPDSDEPRRFSLAQQLCDLLQPATSDQIPLSPELETVVLMTVEALSKFRHRTSDVADALSISMNHGVLYYELRKVIASLSDEAPAEQGLALQEIEWQDATFDLINSLQQANVQARYGERMVAAGVMEIMVEALTIRTSRAERLHEKILQFFTSFIHNIPTAFQTLASIKGLDIIADLAQYEVETALKNANTGNGLPPSFRSKVVDYKIPFYRQSTLRQLFKFIVHMFEHNAGTHDRLLRNLIDTPQILGALKAVVENANAFGANVWSGAINIMSSFIHNEPTSYQVIGEAGLSRSLLEAIVGHGLSSDILQSTPAEPSAASEIKFENNEPLYPDVSGVLPVGETMSDIPTAFGAICLNESGMQAFQASGALTKFFDIFVSPPHVKALEDEGQTASAIGQTFDELARHHPRLKEQITASVLLMVQRVASLCRGLATHKFIGAKLWEKNPEDGGWYVAGGKAAMAGPSYPSSQGEETTQSSKSSPKPAAAPLSSTEVGIQARENASALCYVSACFRFLEGFFHNSSMCTAFCEKGGVEYLLDLATSPSNPYDLVAFSNFSRIGQVFRTMCDNKAHLVIPSVIHRMQDAVHILKDVVDSTRPEGAFAEYTDLATQSNNNRTYDGTTLVKALSHAHFFGDILGRSFSPPHYSSRHSSQTNQLFTSLNFTDIYLGLLDSLSKLHASSIWENLALQKCLPQEMKEISDPKPFVPRRVDAHGLVEIGNDNKPSEGAQADNNNNPETSPTAPLSDDSFIARNVKAIRFLFSQTPATLEGLFRAIGMGLVPKRTNDSTIKQHAAMVAEKLAKCAIWEMGFQKYAEVDQTMDLKYTWGVLCTVTHIMLRNSFSMETYNHKETITLVLNKFYILGGFAKLQDAALKFSDVFQDKSQKGDQAEMAAREGLKTILDFYNNIVRSKCITEALQSSVISFRDHKQPDYFVPGQFVVELRDAILPVISKLWFSPSIDQIGDHHAKQVIEILRIILRGEGEERALKRSDDASRRVPINKPTFTLRNRRGMAELESQLSASPSLVAEALYRCNGALDEAREYIVVRQLPRPAPRFPMPDSDAANDDAPSQEPSSSEMARPRSVDMADAVNEQDIEPSIDSSTNAATADGRPGSGEPMSDDDSAGPFGLPARIGEQDLMAMVGSSRLQDLLNLANGSSASRTTTTAQPAQDTHQPYTTIEELDEKRSDIRDMLIDRCLEILSAIPSVTFELADLIQAAVARSGEGANPRADIGSTLVSSLLSLQGEEGTEGAGVKISAYAHLVALILQDRDFFDSTIDELKDYFNALVGWVKLQPDQKPEDAPWMEMVLLIIERVLAEDEQPAVMKWDPPPADDPLRPMPSPELPAGIVTQELRSELFDAIIDILPKIGKNSTLALSLARVLVILTRRRHFALRLCEKPSVSRLFLMIRQNAGFVDEKLQSATMVIIRHMVEDENMVRQIMKTEIRTAFETHRSSRGMDTATFTRNLYHLVLRDPELFVQVTQELVEIVRFDGNAHRAQQLALKKQKPGTTAEADTSALSNPSSSIERESAEISKETKFPTVESPDGIISYLLRELSNYKDVDDPSPAGTDAKGENESEQVREPAPKTADISMPDAVPGTTSTGNGAQEVRKQEKPAFKPEEHPIFIYRCFILQCLSELLASYTRAKVEFINFSRKPESVPATPSKPRAGTLNYLLNTLVPVGTLEHQDTISHRKRQATSYWAQMVLVSLCAKTQERVLKVDPSSLEEPELAFVRKFVIEHAIRSLKEATVSTEPLDQRYSKVLGLGEVLNRMLNGKVDRANASSDENFAPDIGKIMYEKNAVDTMTSALAEIDLNFPNAKRAVKYILGPLKKLTFLGVAFESVSSSSSIGVSTDDDEISSATSISDDDEEDEREQTPDLLRNTTLGMLESGAGDEESESGSDGDEEDIYDEYDEEMDYEEEPVAEHGDVVSDEDEDVDGMGHVEGLPGDVDMDVELVMDGSEEDDSEDDEEDIDDEEDDDEEDDDELAEFGEMMDEITGDDENASLVDHDEEGVWEEDDQEEFDQGHELDDDGSPHVGPLEHIAHVLGADDHSDSGDPDGVVRIDMGDGGEQFFEDEMAPEDDDDDDNDEEEEADYENDVVYEPELEDEDDDGQDFGWAWDVPPPAAIVHRSHNHTGLPRGLNEMFGMIGGDLFRAPTLRTHRTASAARGEDDGTNPLLQRDGSVNIGSRERENGPESILSRMGRRNLGAVPLPSSQPTAFLRAPAGWHSGEQFINSLVAAVGHPPGPAGGTINVSLDGMGVRGLPPIFSIQGRHGGHALIDINGSRPWRDPISMPFWNGRSEGHAVIGTEEAHAVHFTPTITTARWQEEARMLFGGKHHEKATRVIHALMRILIPPAMVAKQQADKEKAEREAEEARVREEERKKTEAERVEREAREKQEREEREAREAEEAVRRAQELRDNAEDAAEMEGLEQSQGEPGTGPTAGGGEEAPQERITTTIRGREIDITTLGIDREYLEALPEEMREEVIMQQLHEHRTQAVQSGEQPTEISREFLEALPREIQAELLRQEAADRRRREREEARRAAQQTGNSQSAQPEEMNNADFMAMLDPALRQAVLLDADENTLASLPEELQAEARALTGERLPRPSATMRRPHLEERPSDRTTGADAGREEKRRRRPVAQILDKPGVATILRLMFVSMPGKAKANMHSILGNACRNTQNRAEIISILLSILHDATADMGAVERSFAQLSLKARQTGLRTPQPMKQRSLTSNVIPSPGLELSPLNIVHQCLKVLSSLTHGNPRVASFFLNEHETITSQRARVSRKGKGRDNKAARFPLNALLTLLDRKLVTESTGVMETLAALLSRVTQPLTILLRRQREAQEAENKADSGNQEERPSTASDVSMAEAPAEPGSASQEQSNDAAKTDETADAPDEKKANKQLEPPEVPEENIRLVVNILAARECPSKTFSDTLDIIKNLSAVPGAKEAFGRELVRQAQELGRTVVSDLEELADQIDAAQSGTDLQGIALANFSSAGAKQRKLLRVLLALDHLFDPKRMAQSPNMPSPMDPKVKDDVLALLYDSVTFGRLWSNLSLCLAAIRRRGNMVNVATILLPLIESFMVVCRNTTLKNTSQQTAGSAPPVEVTVSSPPPESRIEGLFYQFTEDNRKILNELIRNNSKLLSGHLSILAKNSKVLEFDNKRVYFSRKLHHRGGEARTAHPTLQLNVRREQVFLDSFKSLYYRTGDEIKYGKLNIRFSGEEGIDAGGVSREWFAAMARQMFNPDYALFNPVASDRTTFHPNPLSNVNDEHHLLFFKFIGRIIGKALYEGRVLDCYFSRAVYRRILGKSVSLKDMESLDLDYYKSLVWILENDITDVTFETFSVDISRFGEIETIDLIENGRNIPVTEENKAEYVRLVVEHRLIKSVEDQLNHFLTGFHEIIPPELISIFNEQELELLISGLPEIDVDDWKNNSEYHNYQATSPQIQWFWRAVRSFDKEEKAKLLQFVTGTSKVPLNGFKELEGMNGFAKFNIHRDYSNKEKLPSSHTCFNQLDLPEYESYEHLRQQLYTAITAGSEYFGFA